MPILLIVIISIIAIIYKTKIEAKQTEEKMQTEKTATNIEETNEKNEYWKIEIPKIALTANILEGTDTETLNQYVGHFSSTPKKEGNIGLAAHNRGYPVNYFENLNKLKGGEQIIYTYGEFTKVYIVTKNIKISETDWSYLENSNENKITLITCIANEPEYRRCVQAIEKEEK